MDGDSARITRVTHEQSARKDSKGLAANWNSFYHASAAVMVKESAAWSFVSSSASAARSRFRRIEIFGS